jgi:hypothetical protein
MVHNRLEVPNFGVSIWALETSANRGVKLSSDISIIQIVIIVLCSGMPNYGAGHRAMIPLQAKQNPRDARSERGEAHLQSPESYHTRLCRLTINSK